MNFDLFSSLISKKLNLSGSSAKNTIKLLSEGATVPFISRYRKEMTGSLDEVAIGSIKECFDELNEILKRKEYILKTIDEQGKLSDSLRKSINDCWETIPLEDIYLPFKKKVTTKASVARKKGLEPLAKIIMRQETQQLIRDAKRFINSEVKDEKLALEGARNIIAEWVNENTNARNIVRRGFNKTALITSKVNKKKEALAEKYKDYFSFSEPLAKIPSHRLLAIFRGESEGFLKVKLEVEDDTNLYHLGSYFIKTKNDCSAQIKEAIADAYKRLLFGSIDNEYRKKAKEKADEEAISVFAENLKQLLLAPPLGSKNILAIDPGFRSGCKVVVLDHNGNLIINSVIYPHPPQMKVDDSLNEIDRLIKKYQTQAIAIGNGTAGNETLSLLKSLANKHGLDLFLVNESGASIYSASAVAREEFPDHDLTVRGAVSIGRRLMDPLAELVKIDPKSIGVGQYQHDVNQSKLKSKLDQVVENCVNTVGVNLNTASKHLLSHVSGLGPTIAKNIVDYRSTNGDFISRKDLKEVPRLGNKAFEQAAGFLRIKSGKVALDNTGVHPERYKLVKQIIKDHKIDLANIQKENDKLNQISLNQYVDENIGLPTLTDIIKELKKPGLDPRGKAMVFHFADGVNTIEDLRIGMVVPGIVNNLTKFGAFVDIGIKESGLLHISQIVNRFIKDPAEVLKLNQEVSVKITDIEVNRKRISLTMKDL